MAAHFGSRLRKGAATTAVAAAAVAALSASQAPGVTVDDHGRRTAADTTPSPETGADGSATGNSPYYTDLPPLNSPRPDPSSTAGTPVVQGPAEAGIPATVLDAYKKAADSLRAAKPGCNLPWQLLAAIGKVESGHARGGRVNADGTTLSPIFGPQLDGNGFALIKDTDGGAYDGNSSYDHAVGPMQFIPSTWAWAGRDGNGDGTKDPSNVYDAALAAAHYLCRNGWDLSTQADLDSAVLSYNNSRDYLNTVMRWLEYYRKGSHEIPDGTGGLPTGRSDTGSGGTRPAPSPQDTRTPDRPGESQKPTAPGKPTEPAGPGKPTEPAPPGTGSPTPPPGPGSPTPPPSGTPTDTVDHLENAGTTGLTATAGQAFAERIGTRAETAAGEAVGKVRIRYTIIGDTDATFAGGESVAVAVTDSSGVAVAPVLRAGEKTGSFTVRATVAGRAVPGLDYKATVTERVADTLARTATTALTCTPGGTFAHRVEVRATYKGAAANGVAVTATLIRSAQDPAVNDRGPYFKDAAGKPVRTLTGLRTDARGLLTLPELFADDTAGTFVLRVTTAGGATLDVELTVQAAQTSPSASASPSASTSPSASPGA
ncbi:lytic transglycosylase domain-containing protein [Streptomyces leeuwenhoekii]|uniref:Secreted Protein n=1 Tax=Streptomyces leeuwenhoekii TaxID=1437453 RepID=A0A0F7W5V8_STRLW|nr:lytic transglycosylase domain-containing protein [Streptomyces leeuwenhoekii]CQR64596.1 Secreted Protein [Streptomyces leeuwenhoekii]